MKYQKIANLLESASDNLSKFRTKNWVEINDDSRVRTLMLILNLNLQC